MQLKLMIDLIKANEADFKKYNATYAHKEGTAQTLCRVFNAYVAEADTNPKALVRELRYEEIAELIALFLILRKERTCYKLIDALFGLKEFAVYVMLNQNHLLTKVNVDLFISHPDKKHLITILIRTQNRYIALTAENLQSLFNHPKLEELAEEIVALAEFYRLNAVTFAAILLAVCPKAYVKQLVADEEESVVTITKFYMKGKEDSFKLADEKLQKNNLLGYRTQVLTHPSPSVAALGLIKLIKYNLATPKNIAVIFNHPKPFRAAILLCTLYSKHRMNTDRERQLVAQCKKPSKFEYSLGIINGEYNARRGDDNSVPYEVIVPYLIENRQVNNVGEIDTVLRYLGRGGLLNLNNIQNALRHHAKLSHNSIYGIFFSRIPEHLLTQALFDNVFRLCALHHLKDFLTHLNDYVTQVLEEAPVAPLNLIAATHHFNPTQSTHTSSVHVSVSHSAVHLNETYGLFPFDESIVLNEMRDWLATLDNHDPQIAAAKRGFARLQTYSYIDSRSNISTTRLLALYWQAMHDHERCTATFADARKRMLNTLYEIQREYNIKHNEAPDVMPDKPTCTSGAFNAIVAGGWGHHPMCHIVYVTKDAAALKLAKVALEVAQAYLTALLMQDPVKVTGYVNDIREQTCISPVWEVIKSIVADKIFEEFQEAFPLGKAHSDFTDMIDAGEYVAVPPDFFKRMEQQQNVVKMAAVLAEGKFDGMSNLTKIPDTILIDIAAMTADAPLAHTKLAVSLAHHGFWNRANTVVKMISNRVQKELDELVTEPELKRRKIA